jgi:hypothetical protein
MNAVSAVWGIGGLVAGFYVVFSARYGRGRSIVETVLWGIVTMLIWVVGLPLYLLVRRNWPRIDRAAALGPRRILVFVGRKQKLLDWAAKELQRQDTLTPAITYTVKGGEPVIEARRK